MKNFKFYSVLLVVSIFTANNSFCQLPGGSYTIGPTGNYKTFTEAVDTLVSQGISGAVTFDVQDGIYNEQIEIPAINGASGASTITFQSQSLDSTKVALTFTASSSGDNYVVKLDSADYITFRKMTFLADGPSYARVFHFLGGASNNAINNCIILGVSTTNTSTRFALIYSYQTQDENNSFQNNLFIDGSYGIQLYGANSSTLSAGTQIINNQFYNQGEYGIRLYNQDAPVINNNIIDLNNSSAYGIKLEYSDNDLQIRNNKINVVDGTRGIYLINCDGIFIQMGLIANNFITVGGTSTCYGIQLDNSTYQNVYYNSINITSNNTNGRGFYSNSGTNIDIRNNIFANFGGGYAYYNSNTTNLNSDYNDYFTTGNFLAYWGSNLENLANLATANGMDVNSVSVNPVFTSSTDLHTTTFRLDSIADNSVGVTADIDGDIRSGTPDIGADEFTGSGTPLAGPYTIGGASPDFATFTDAVDSLNEVGISASVMFNIIDGSYSEQISILSIAGADASNTITFQSVSGDSSAVELTFSAGISNNYVVELLAADYITFKKMTFSATGGTYSKVFSFVGNARNDSILNSIINGNATNDAAINSTEAFTNNIVVANNIISNGNYGIYFNGANSVYSTGVKILNNTLSGQDDGIYLEDHDAPEVSGNVLDNSLATSYYAIELKDCSNDLKVQRNKITSEQTYGGIFLNYCTGTASKKGLVANNFVDIGGISYAYGIRTDYSDYQNIYYNSVRITSINTTYGRAYFNENGSNLDVRNNIFTNFGGGYAYHNNSNPAIVNSDYNDLFTTGTFIGYWSGANLTDLSAFKSANLMDVNSLSANPGFVSSTDMHTTSSFLDGAAAPLAAVVTDDIDGDPRDAATPDIGADEFTATLFPLSGPYTIGGTFPDYTTFTDAVYDLNNLGVAGWVTFYVRSGTYPEHIEILEIAGAGAADTIVFRPDTNNSTPVVLTYNASTSGNDYVIWINNTDYITFRNLTLAATGNSYARVINISGNVNELKLLNNILSSSNSAASASVVYSNNNITNNILLSGNTIVDGGSGIYLNGNNSTSSTGTQIISNILNGQSSKGIYLEDQDAPVVIGNDVTNTGAASYYGIQLEDCDNALQVLNNKVVSDNNYDGIKLGNCNGSFSFEGLIANNFSQVGGTGTAYGISFNSCGYQNIYHNSIHITSTNTTTGRAIYVNGGTNINIINNIFANSGGGYAYYINTPAAIVSSDYNDLYTTGANLAYWSGAQADLSALQIANLMDNNSLSVDPMYNTTTDLHILQELLNEAGTPVAAVTDDIDGHPRDPATPDIGADEFICIAPTFNINATTACFGDSTTFTDISTDVALGSTYYWDFSNDGFYDYTSNILNESFNYLYSSADTYTVKLMIYQIAGCIDTTSFSVIVNPTPLAPTITDETICFDESTPDLTATGTGIILWFSDITLDTLLYTGSSFSTGETAIGIYTYYVTDTDSINGCESPSTIVTLTINSVPVIDITVINTNCGLSDGSALANVSGGLFPYYYAWSNGVTQALADTLGSGIYMVTVTDDNGCSDFTIATISDINGPEITVNNVTEASCNGNSDGAIDINVTGGTGSYTYDWSNGETTQDIDSLIAAPYEINVTDIAGCTAVNSIIVTEPDALNLSVTTTEAGCGGIPNGSATVNVTGGTSPYNYEWIPGGTDSTVTGIAAGIYPVTVTDDNGCIITEDVAVSEAGAPTIIITSIIYTSCGSTDGAVYINVIGGAEPYTYNWSDGSTNENLVGVMPGIYEVTVTGSDNCIATESADISQTLLPVDPICIVTVDSTTGTNLIVWEKSITTGIQSYNIYKETTQSDVYNLIGNVPYDSLNRFVDTYSNPLIRSWRYKISVIDECGFESELSAEHKTMHLTANFGVGGENNLIWDHYEGFDFLTYYIYRYSTSTGWELIQPMPNNLTSFTDPAPPSGLISYRIAVEKEDTCFLISAKTQSGPYSQSLSNIDEGLMVGIKPNLSGQELPFNVLIYPNPNKGVFTIEIYDSEIKNYDLRIYDVLGRSIIKSKITESISKIDLSDYSEGIYLLQIITDKGIVNRKVVVE